MGASPTLHSIISYPLPPTMPRRVDLSCHAPHPWGCFLGPPNRQKPAVLYLGMFQSKNIIKLYVLQSEDIWLFSDSYSIIWIILYGKIDSKAARIGLERPRGRGPSDQRRGRHSRGKLCDDQLSLVRNLLRLNGQGHHVVEPPRCRRIRKRPKSVRTQRHS